MAKGKMVKFDSKLGAYLDEQIERFGIKATKKKMFGHETYFLNGHMYTGANEQGIFVQIGEAAVQAALGDEPGTAPFSPMSGMVMKNYLLLKKEVHADPAALKVWLDRSRAYLGKLGPKIKKEKTGKSNTAVKKTAKKAKGKAGARKKKATAKKKQTAGRTTKKAARKAAKTSGKQARAKAKKTAKRSTKKSAKKSKTKKARRA